MLITLARLETSLSRFYSPPVCQFSVLLVISFLLLVTLSHNILANTQITAARYWAGPEHTRLTLESSTPIKYTITMLDSPKRVVMDMENISLTTSLESLSSRLKSEDPLVSTLRIGRFTQKIVRLVMELKADVVPKAFALDPMDQFGHRLVLDIHPSELAAKTHRHEHDPLMALLQKTEKPTTSKHEHSQPTNIILTATTSKPKMKKTIVVAIDAGHGGKDPGAIGAKGTMEKNVTLSIARKLKAKLDKEPNMRAILTRDGDQFLSLAARRLKARQANADLFVSIHADAAPRKQAHGSSVYALSENGATSTTASWLAKRENEADLIGGIKLDDKDRYLKQTLIDLSMNATIDDSIRLASNVLNEIGTINHLHKRQVEQAGFAVLKSPDIPSILVETAFISNQAEETKLGSDAYQNKLADAIFTGLKRYFDNRPWQTRTEIADTR
jgi:N-acetylmuramoyl-L-alanine amidase